MATRTCLNVTFIYTCLYCSLHHTCNWKSFTNWPYYFAHGFKIFIRLSQGLH